MTDTVWVSVVELRSALMGTPKIPAHTDRACPRSAVVEVLVPIGGVLGLAKCETCFAEDYEAVENEKLSYYNTGMTAWLRDLPIDEEYHLVPASLFANVSTAWTSTARTNAVQAGMKISCSTRQDGKYIRRIS